MRVAVAGKFDIFHDGHLDHILKAAKLGSYLYIITHTDEIVARNSKKGICAIPLWTRQAVLEGIMLRYDILGQVLIAESYGDIDGTCTHTLEKYKPNIFAKGGDRKDNNSMPASEVEICSKFGIEIRYGVGDLKNSSSKIMEAV